MLESVSDHQRWKPKAANDELALTPHYPFYNTKHTLYSFVFIYSVYIIHHTFLYTHEHIHVYGLSPHNPFYNTRRICIYSVLYTECVSHTVHFCIHLYMNIYMYNANTSLSFLQHTTYASIHTLYISIHFYIQCISCTLVNAYISNMCTYRYNYRYNI